MTLPGRRHARFTVSAIAHRSKPVRVIVPFAPGGDGDLTARLASSRPSQKFRQQFAVDNRGGAGGLAGTELVVKAPPAAAVKLAQAAR